MRMIKWLVIMAAIAIIVSPVFPLLACANESQPP
jgi:hypothetical protein